jgi:hypothetical protein
VDDIGRSRTPADAMVISARLRYRVAMKRLIKLVALLFVIMLAAVVIVPLVVLAGLFIWLKLTEEADDEALDLEQEFEPEPVETEAKADTSPET